MLTYFKKRRLKKRLEKTLARLRFKSQNPDSKLYGYFGRVDLTETCEYKLYQIRDFQIKEYKNINKIEFLYKHQKQMEKCKNAIFFVMKPEKIDGLFDRTDDLTNNNT